MQAFRSSRARSSHNVTSKAGGTSAMCSQKAKISNWDKHSRTIMQDSVDEIARDKRKRKQQGPSLL